MASDLINRLRQRLSLPLPGPEAQYRMAHKSRKEPLQAPSDVKMAAVLALFYPWDGDWHLALIERASHHADDRHSGQIAFPGGRYEEGDDDLAFTALRETEEEIGANAHEVEIIGQLTPLYIPVSEYLVHPFVGYMDYRPPFVPDPREVASIIEVSFDHLRHPETVQQTDIRIFEGYLLRNVPYFNVEGRVVWGATAMMLNELVEAMRENP
jgi:8-oxo-dGTP pyrophosphatase MutT (NUDIX family)